MIQIRGVAAELRWGYLHAATLGRWTVEASTLTATVTAVNAFRVTQSPLTFVVGPIERPVTRLQMMDGTLTASLGPKEP